MKADKYIKIDGVQLNVAWVNSMSREKFIADPQVNRLFYRIAEKDKVNALSIVYESITGKKSKSGGKSSPVKESVEVEAPSIEKPVIDEK